MSKIALQGNGSGTGKITIASPNTNSDFTQNLMGVAGTLLAAGTFGSANEKLFVNSAGTGLEFSKGSKIIMLTQRTADTASGNVSYTGVGFKPSSIVFLIFSANVGNIVSVGFSDPFLNGYCVLNNSNVSTDQWTRASSSLSPATIGYAAFTSGNYQYANLISYDDDGFTLQWVKAGTPAGTIYIGGAALCFR